ALATAQPASGGLAAVTGKSGGTVLQLTNIHGDVTLQLPLDGTAPTVLDHDEYGNPRAGQAATRYDWLGAKQRSGETLTGLTLMGVRLYDPATGRFLSSDPVYGGSANAYEYAVGDPVNKWDLDGRFWGILARGAIVGVKWLLRNGKKTKKLNQRNRKEHRTGKSKSKKDKHQNAGRHGGWKKQSQPGWKSWNANRSYRMGRFGYR
ncbi:RHS repeat-associated core domain-containing protein, partial [Streptomyces sp. CB02923]|uniref:RHS repeat-associated core domain-containing protein n=1 Tax=Streptomyces sp. CB02923 TaxID=1718985 RepID=UPI000B06E6FB